MKEGGNKGSEASQSCQSCRPGAKGMGGGRRQEWQKRKLEGWECSHREGLVSKVSIWTPSTDACQGSPRSPQTQAWVLGKVPKKRVPLAPAPGPCRPHRPPHSLGHWSLRTRTSV